MRSPTIPYSPHYSRYPVIQLAVDPNLIASVHGTARGAEQGGRDLFYNSTQNIKINKVDQNPLSSALAQTVAYHHIIPWDTLNNFQVLLLQYYPEKWSKLCNALSDFHFSYGKEKKKQKIGSGADTQHKSIYKPFHAQNITNGSSVLTNSGIKKAIENITQGRAPIRGLVKPQDYTSENVSDHEITQIIFSMFRWMPGNLTLGPNSQRLHEPTHRPAPDSTRGFDDEAATFHENSEQYKHLNASIILILENYQMYPPFGIGPIAPPKFVKDNNSLCDTIVQTLIKLGTTPVAEGTSWKKDLNGDFEKE